MAVRDVSEMDADSAASSNLAFVSVVASSWPAVAESLCVGASRTPLFVPSGLMILTDMAGKQLSNADPSEPRIWPLIVPLIVWAASVPITVRPKPQMPVAVPLPRAKLLDVIAEPVFLVSVPPAVTGLDAWLSISQVEGVRSAVPFDFV